MAGLRHGSATARTARGRSQPVTCTLHVSWDERLTSLAAEKTLVSAGMRRRARRAVLDQVAATMILQGFLDRQRIMADRGES